MAECAATEEMWTPAFDHLVQSYSEPHRHYHNLEHIQDMLVLLGKENLSPHQGFKNIELATLEDIANLELAAWFHDVVYDPRGSDNEVRSADVARRIMQNLKLKERRIVRVCDLILMTKEHRAFGQDDLAAQFFLDVDLSILGAPQDRYQAYAKAIRQEYAHVPERAFYSARRSVLDGFLSRPSIFNHWAIRSKLETKARFNIAAEIAQIDDLLRTLPS